MSLELTTSTTLIFTLLAVAGVLALLFLAPAARNRTGMRIARMMPRAGVDLTALARRPARSEGLADVARVCARCPHTERCDAWLRDPVREGVPDFCPNREQLAGWSGAGDR